jgi:hypothetical protein
LAKAEDLAHLCPSAKADGNLCSFCAKPANVSTNDEAESENRRLIPGYEVSYSMNDASSSNNEAPLFEYETSLFENDASYDELKA